MPWGQTHTATIEDCKTNVTGAVWPQLTKLPVLGPIWAILRPRPVSPFATLVIPSSITAYALLKPFD